MTPDCTTPHGMIQHGMAPEEARSATVIPFPFPSRPAPDADAADKARLERALRALDAALGEQRAAVAAWRHTLDDLGSAMHSLGNDMLRYRDSVATLDEGVARMRTQAAELTARADAMTAAAHATPPAAGI